MPIDRINVFNSLLDNEVENEVKAVCHGKVSGKVELLLLQSIDDLNENFPRQVSLFRLDFPTIMAASTLTWNAR